ncbi:MAG: PqiC family protein [Variovorax sp.]
MAAATLLLAACAGPADRFYSLAAPTSAPPAVSAASGGVPMWIEVAPLAVPERLARPQLVVRSGGATDAARVEVLDQHRWASSFESELRDALSSGIASRLGALDGTRGGRPAAAPVTRIAVQVRRFDVIDGSGVEADFGWTLRRAEQARVLVCQMRFAEPVAGTGYGALAEGAQRLTSNAAAAIARSVAALQANPEATCPA